MELYLHSPNTPSWRGGQLKHRDSFTFIFYLYNPSVWLGDLRNSYIISSTARHSKPGFPEIKQEQFITTESA
jgi:hypothetical protein